MFTRILLNLPFSIYCADHPLIDFLFNLRRVQYLDLTSMGPAAAPRFLEAFAESEVQATESIDSLPMAAIWDYELFETTPPAGVTVSN